MENHEFADTMNFTPEFALGRQRRRKWVSLITQQLRLRHVYQVYVYNIKEDIKAFFYFTLHSTAMSSPFYTSEKVSGKHLKWDELFFSSSIDTNISSVVIRVWKTTKNNDEVLITLGVNLSGLVYLGNKITELQPKYFKANSVIFLMQGVYFTSQNYIRNDLDKPLPFQQNLNLIEINKNEVALYKRVAVKVPKIEVTSSYTLDRLRRLQELQRQLKKKKVDVQEIKDKIKSATERESKQEIPDPYASSYANNIRFAPQLLTMNSLNKMLHEKPTRAEREAMTNVSKQTEVRRFRLRMLREQRDTKTANLRRLKQKAAKMAEENEEKNSNLMSLYYTLSKESQQWDEYRQGIPRRKDMLVLVRDQLRHRQLELLKELLFIYPIDKIPNENKFTMLGIHLPDSELLLDYQDPGISVVLGYICHVLIMCSIFLQVPLRHPMKHFGSRSVIYNQVYPDIPDKEREFPLYTKGKDRVHFSYAVFLLNKNISQLRWFVHHKFTVDLKETLKHLRSFLLADDMPEYRHSPRYLEKRSQTRHQSDVSTGTLTADSAVSLDKLVSPSLSSISSSNLIDPLLDRIHDEIRSEQLRLDSHPTPSPKKKISAVLLKSSTKRNKKEKCSKGSSEVLAVPEAYLNRQISKDLFQRCASEGYRFEENPATYEESPIKIREGVAELHANATTHSSHSDSIEEGTDPLDPSTNIDAMITKSIDINRDPRQTQECSRQKEQNRFSRSMDSCVNDSINSFFKACELGSDPIINMSCDSSSNSIKVLGTSEETGVNVGQQLMLEQWLMADQNILPSSDLFSEEVLRVSLQDISSPLTERTDRLLSTNQSFNLVKHRPLE